MKRIADKSSSASYSHLLLCDSLLTAALQMDHFPQIVSYTDNTIRTKAQKRTSWQRLNGSIPTTLSSTKCMSWPCSWLMQILFNTQHQTVLHTCLFKYILQDWNVQFRHKPSISTKVQFGQATLQMTSFIHIHNHPPTRTHSFCCGSFTKWPTQKVTIVCVLQKTSVLQD